MANPDQRTQELRNEASSQTQAAVDGGADAGGDFDWLKQAYQNQYQAHYDYAGRADPYLGSVQQAAGDAGYELAIASRHSGDQRGAQLSNTGAQYGSQLTNAGNAYGSQLSNAGTAYGANLQTAANNAANNLSSSGDMARAYGTQQGGALSQYGAAQASALQNTGALRAADLNRYGREQQAQISGAGEQAMQLGMDAAGRAGPQLDFTQQNARMNAVGAQARQLSGFENTEGPSAAQAQLRSALNDSQSANLAMARSGRGWGGSAQALSQAQAQNAAAGQQAANQSAMLRAQENAAWRQRQAANASAAGQLQSAMAQQALSQQALGAQTSLQSQAQNDQALQAMYGLGTNALAQGASAGLGAAGQAQQMALNAQLGGAQLGAETLAQGGALGMQGYGMQNQAAANAANASIAGAQGAGALGLQGLQAGAGAQLQGLQSAAGTELQAQQAAGAQELAGYGQAGTLFNQGLAMGLTAEQQRGQIYGAQQQIEQQYISNALQQQATAAGVSLGNTQANNQMAGAGIGAAGMALAALPLLMSDRNEKEGIAPANVRLLEPSIGQTSAASSSAGAADAARARAQGMNAQPGFLSQLGTGLGGVMQTFGNQLMSDEREKESVRAVEATPGYSFDYKDPEAMGAEPGRQFGVMAQDLEKTPAGRSTVTRTPDGKRMVDTSRLTMVNTAALNAMQKHIDELDKMVRSKRGKAA